MSIKDSLVGFWIKWNDFIILGFSFLLLIFGIVCFTKMAKIQESIKVDEKLNYLDTEGNIVENGEMPLQGSIITFGIVGTILLIAGCWIFSWFAVRCKSELDTSNNRTRFGLRRAKCTGARETFEPDCRFANLNNVEER